MVRFTSELYVVDTHQFSENEAWIAFKINDAPISTERDGDFFVVCLMDVATGLILGNQFVAIQSVHATVSDVEEIMTQAFVRTKTAPRLLYISPELESSSFFAYCESNAIDVVTAIDKDVSPVLAEAREGFQEHIGGGRLQ